VLLKNVKQAIRKKTTDSYKFPTDIELAAIVHEANLYVCGLCEPSELIRENLLLEKESRVLRHLENGQVIKVPEYPDFKSSKLHLQMDEALTFATIHYSCFIISKHKNFDFKAQADEIINIYRSNFSSIIYGEENCHRHRHREYIV